MLTRYALGLDWINKSLGWAFAVLTKEKDSLVATLGCLSVGHEKEQLIGNAACVIVDAPIGLPDDSKEGCKLRPCDEGARRWVGNHQRSSIFAVPFYGELQEWIRREEAAKKQKLGHFRGLLPAINSARLIHQQHEKVLESHPELCFTALSGMKLPPSASKKTLIGTIVRLAILRNRGVIVSLEQLNAQGRIPTDNFIDAISMALIAFYWQADQDISVVSDSSGDACRWCTVDKQSTPVMALPRDYIDTRKTAVATPQEIISLASSVNFSARNV
jgi:hypothetical protein